MQTTTLATVLLLTVTLGLGAPAHAGPGGRGDRPCKEDVQRLCPDLERGGGGIRQCLDENRDSLSDACFERLEQRRTRMEGLRDACADDAAALCPDLEPGRGGGLGRCLQEQRDSLSEACASAIAGTHQRR